MDSEKYYQMAQNQLKRQLDEVDRLNNKVNTLLVVCGVLIVFFGDVLLRKLWGPALGLPFIITSMIYLLISYRIIDWHQGPNINRIVFDLENGVAINNFYIEAIKSIKSFYNQNEELMVNKTKRINRAGKLLLYGMIASIIGSIYLF